MSINVNVVSLIEISFHFEVEKYISIERNIVKILLNRINDTVFVNIKQQVNEKV